MSKRKCSYCNESGHNVRTCPLKAAGEKSPNDPYRLYVDYEQLSSGGEPHDPGDRWSTCEDVYHELSIKGVYRSMDVEGAPFFFDSLEVPKETFEADEVYLVVVRFESGGSFVRTHGEHEIEGIYADCNEAEKVAASIRDDTYEGYKPWEGYFERLEDVDIHKFRVKAAYDGPGVLDGVRFFDHT